MKKVNIQTILMVLLPLLLMVFLTGCSVNHVMKDSVEGIAQGSQEELLYEENMAETGEVKMTTRTIYLAGGCFWGMQKFFDQFDGVTKTEVGYANGPSQAPTYQQVCSDSGHAETVRIDYDPDRISLDELLGYYLPGTDVIPR